MFASCKQNAEENHYMKLANKSVENVAYLMYTTYAYSSNITNFMLGVINSRLNSENAG